MQVQFWQILLDRVKCFVSLYHFRSSKIFMKLSAIFLFFFRFTVVFLRFLGMRTVPRLDSSPTDTSPRTIPRLTLPRRTFPRTDNSPTGHFPEGHFPDWTLPRLDFSPLRHFPERTFPWPHVLVRFFFFSNHFLFVYTRIY